MPTLNQIQTLAQTLDPKTDQCSVVVKRASWNNVEEQFPIARELNASLFKTDSSITIARNRVFKTKVSDSFLQLFLFWGFPTNMHGVGTSAFNNWKDLKDLYKYLRRKPHLTIEEYRNNIIPQFWKMKGLGLSFFSKLLYFMNVTIDGAPAVIMDSFVRNGIGCVRDEAMVPLNNVARDNYKAYPLFLREMQSLANRLDTTPERLEYVFWLAGKNH